MKNLILPVGILVLVGIVTLSGCGGNDTKATSPDFRASADDLINEHVRSQATAKSKYEGKTIRLSGKVFMVWDSKDNIVNSPYLHIAHSGSRPDHIACCFNSAQSVQSFSQGRLATVVGKYGGTMKGGTAGSFIILLKDCVTSQ